MICFAISGSGQRTCTCGVAEDTGEPADTGVANIWPFFPILSFNIGDTGHVGREWLEFLVGPLICEQGNSQSDTFIKSHEHRPARGFFLNADENVKKYKYQINAFLFSNEKALKIKRWPSIYFCQWITYRLSNIRSGSYGVRTKYACIGDKHVPTDCHFGSHVSNVILFNVADIVYRWFDTNPGRRQTVSVTIDAWATTAGKCAMKCLNDYDCISFNFQKIPTPICELSALPHNALSASYGPDAAWSHYSIRIEWEQDGSLLTWWRHQMETFSALRSPVNSPHKGQWRGAFMFSLICAWINRWVNNREAGDLRRLLWRHRNEKN